MDTSAIWKIYSAALKGFIQSKVKDEDVAKDLLQEVFVKVHLHKDSLRDQNSVRPWLYRIANNLAMDHFKAKSFAPGVPQNVTEEEISEGHNPFHCLKPLIQNMPKLYREAFTLSEIEGKKQTEVARMLNISISGAKSRIQRGRKLLQRGFVDCCDYTLTQSGVLVGERKIWWGITVKTCSPWLLTVFHHA